MVLTFSECDKSSAFQASDICWVIFYGIVLTSSSPIPALEGKLSNRNANPILHAAGLEAIEANRMLQSKILLHVLGALQFVTMRLLRSLYLIDKASDILDAVERDEAIGQSVVWSHT